MHCVSSIIFYQLFINSIRRKSTWWFTSKGSFDTSFIINMLNLDWGHLFSRGEILKISLLPDFPHRTSSPKLLIPNFLCIPVGHILILLKIHWKYNILLLYVIRFRKNIPASNHLYKVRTEDVQMISKVLKNHLQMIFFN